MTLGGSLGWTDFEYKEYLWNGVDMADEFQKPYMAEWNARLSAQYDFAEPGFGGTADVRLDSRGRDEGCLTVQPITDPVLADLALIEEHWILDARAGIREVPLRDAAFSVSLRAKNLLDEEDVIDFGPQALNQTAQYINERTVGVDFSVSF